MTTQTTNNSKTGTKKELVWVTGSCKKGFTRHTTRPRVKNVPEPFETREAAERWIALQYLLNA